MRIHVRFTIQGAQGTSCRAGAFFYSENGTPLHASGGGAYHTPSGQVTVQKEFVPRFSSSRWDDFKLFMPIKQLGLSNGNNRDLQLMAQVMIYCKYAQTALAMKPFTFTLHR